MEETKKPMMWKHISEDWCHWCREISKTTVDISYRPFAEQAGYVRVCLTCLENALKVSQEETP